MPIYESYGRSIFPVAERTAVSNRSGFQTTIGVKHAILRLYVSAVTSGSITALNIYVAEPTTLGTLNATTEAIFYKFPAAGDPPVSITAPGLYTFGILGSGSQCEGLVKTGPWPPTWDVEVIQAPGSDITWGLQADFVD